LAWIALTTTDLLAGKTAVVTGSASGIGRATAVLMAAEGAAVVVADIRREPREGGVATDLLITQGGGEATFVKCDVTQDRDVGAAMDAAEAYGGVDILVNNAGVFRGGDFLTVSETDYEAMMAINARAPFFVAQAAARRMAPKGAGVIINLSSVAGLQGAGGFVLYCMTKGAVRLMSLAMADELAPSGIRVICLHPGFIETSMTKVDVPVVGTETGDAFVEANPMRRAGTPEDVAKAALFLACDLAGYVNGISLSIDGGMLRI
jgi:NAD(P)-dependent dehydrogenase (short-subunit alcohol dehydrogenase family)